MDNDEFRRQGRDAFDRIKVVLDGKPLPLVVDVLTELLVKIVLQEPKEAQRQALAALIDMLKDRIAEPLQ